MDSAPNIPDYEITGELGRGGMGVVYRAKKISTGQDCALKVLPSTSSEMLIKRFDQELRIVTMLDHPDIVKVFDTGWGLDVAFMSMEILDGYELWEAMPDKRFSFEDRISVLCRVARGLHHAHTQGVVHRDVKPSNVFLTRDGGVRLLDFGIAKMKDVRITKTGKTVGTPQYMAPEQIMAQGVTDQTDVFATASVSYEVFAGVPPWQADHDHALMMKICTTPAASFSDAFKTRGWFDIDATSLNRLHALLHKGLSPEPTRRHASCAEFAQELEGFLSEHDTDGEVVPVTPQQRWSERRLDWAAGRALRLKTSGPSTVADADEVRPSILDDDEDDDEGGGTMLWIALTVLFGGGLLVALWMTLG